MSIIITMIGTAATPLIIALQISAFTGSSGVKFRAAPTRWPLRLSRKRLEARPGCWARPTTPI